MAEEPTPRPPSRPGGGRKAPRLRPHFRRQQLVQGFIADFYCHAAGGVVEVDGGVHDEQPEADAARDRTVAALGLLVLRFRNEEVTDRLPDVLERTATTRAKRISEQQP